MAHCSLFLVVSTFVFWLRKVLWIRELVEDHKIVVPFVEADKNIADFLTKPLPAKKFFAIRRVIMNEC